MGVPALTAKADYTRQTVYTSTDFTLSSNNTVLRTPVIPYDFNSTGYVSISVSPALSSGASYALYSSASNTRTTYFTPDTPIDISQWWNNRNLYIRISSTSQDILSVQSITYNIIYSGSDPDLGVKSQEQRYNTNTLYSADFTQSNSLPLIYSGSLFLSDFTPNGNCNSIQVDASTVGGNQLEWRLNLGQSGIDGQSAWVPIGFKLPIQVGAFDEHSIQLRMKDPNDPTQYYQLQPSELSMCSVTYGYMTDVYLSLPPAEYQTLPSEQMPTFPTYTVPTAPDVSQYVSAPASVLTSIFNMFMASPVAIVFTLLIFAFIIKCVIW